MIPNLTWDTLGGDWNSLLADPDAQWDLATLSLGDSVGVRTSESSTLIQSFSDRQDSLRVRTTEGPSLLLSMSTRSDTLQVGLTELSLIAGVVSVFDTLGVRTTEGTSLLQAFSTRSDSLRVAVTESSEISVTLDVLDSLGVRLSEAQQSFLSTNAVDAISVRVGEVTTIIVIVGSDSEFPVGVDTLQVAILEDSVYCVVDWPQQSTLANSWNKASAAAPDPWTKAAPVTTVWGEDPPLDSQKEGCTP